MITFALAGLSWYTATPIPGTIYWLTGLIDGILFLPLSSMLAVPYLGRLVREKAARLHYLQAVAPFAGAVLVLKPEGYEIGPYENGKVLLSGKTLSIDEERRWYRLGKRKFGVTYQPDEAVLGDWSAVDENVEVVEAIHEDDAGNTHVEEVVIEGVGALLAKKRGQDIHGYTPYHDDNKPDGLLVSLSRSINSLRGGGGVRLSETQQEMTRMDKGGGDLNMDNSSRLLYGSLSMISGAIIAVLIFGVL